MPQILNPLNITVNTGGTVTLPTGTSHDYFIFSGTSTLASGYNVTPAAGAVEGMLFRINWNAQVTFTGGVVTIFGTSLTQVQALSELTITCYYNGSSWDVDIIETTPQVWVKTSLNSVYVEGATAYPPTGVDSFDLGVQNRLTGDYTYGVGISVQASAPASGGVGAELKAWRMGQLALGADTHNANLNHFSQTSLLYPLRSTSQATPGKLLLYYTEEITVANNSIMLFEGSITAIQQGGISGSVGTCSTFVFKGAIKNVGGTTSMIGTPVWLDSTGAWTTTPSAFLSDAAASTWSIALAANNTLDCLEITATGENDKTIWWTGRLLVNETNVV